ncbi:MAG: hypothetical protein IJM18_06845 [Clostridia bacterium]|nr:hypothetical protein [Clostridia bacterium]
MKEGGVYYVRWDHDEDGSLSVRISTEYLRELPSARDLRKIRKGDPYSKLEMIDKNAGITLRLGSGAIAYSLASNGKVFGFPLDTRTENDDYTITGVQDFTDKEIFLSMILKEDYPGGAS